MRSWKLHEAKAKLHEIVKEAKIHGPQEITLRGEPVAIILSYEEYKKLAKPKPSLVEFMRQSPLAQAKINLKFDRS